MESFRNGFTIDVRRLRVLRELKRRGTVGATAQALALTPSAISQRLSALGREVGVPLLAPQGRRVRLTPQAELLLEHAAAIDAQLERARADLAAFEDGQAGRVAIGAFATAIHGLVLPALTRLQQARPRLELHIAVDDWSALLGLVAAGRGVGLVPALAVGSAPPDGVVLRPPRGPQRPVRHLYAAARAGTERSPSIAPVVAELLAVARELEAELVRRTARHGRAREPGHQARGASKADDQRTSAGSQRRARGA